jgi:hypothetical protein
MNNMITLPVQARMVKQPDGSYKMTEAQYITVEADAVARFLLAAFDVPVKAVQQ